MSKKLIFLSLLVGIFMLSMVSAFWETHAINLDTGSGANGNQWGMRFMTKGDYANITVITKHALSNVVRGYLLDQNGTMLVNATFTSNNATINYRMSPNTFYYVVADGDGASVTHRQTSAPPSYPVLGTFVNWTSGYAGGNDPNGAEDIIGINVVNTSNEGTGGFPLSVNTSLNTPSNNSLQIDTDIFFNATTKVTNGNASNATIYIYRSNGTVFNISSLNMTSTSNDTIFNITGFTSGMYVWNVLGCGVNSSATLCNMSNLNRTFTWGYQINSNTYNLTSYVSSIESFRTNITFGSGLIVSSVNLFYNGTSYPGTATNIGGGQYSFLRSITVPLGTGAKYWFWSINLQGGNQINTTQLNQTISSLTIDNCTTSTKQIFNFSLFDEDLRTTRINGTVEVIVDFYNPDRSILTDTFNKSFTVSEVNTAQICWTPTNGTYSVDYQTKYYGNSSYSIENKYEQAIVMSNNTLTQNVPLYDLLAARTTAFKISLQSSTLSTISGAVIDIQRQYLPINQYISVESPLTGSDGSTVAHLVAQEPSYNFIVKKDGVLLGTFNNYLVQCQNPIISDCRINLNIIEATQTPVDFQTYGNISTAYIFNQNTNTLDFSYSSNDNQVHTVLWNVSLFDNYGNNTICSSTFSGTYGSGTCAVPSNYGNSSVLSAISSDGNFLGTSSFSAGVNPSEIFGGVRLVLALLLFSTLTLFMLADPAFMIIGSLLGMVFGGLLHLYELSNGGGSWFGVTSIFLWLVIAAFLIIFKMGRKY